MVALVCAGGAWPAMARKVPNWVPSVEAAVARADRVMRARLRLAKQDDVSFGMKHYEAEVLETIKGTAPVGARVTFSARDHYDRRESWPGEWLVCLEQNLVAFGEDGELFALDGRERFAFSMDGQPLRDGAAILKLARQEARRETGPAVHEVWIPGLEKQLTGVFYKSSLLVPADERLEQLAWGWSKGTDPAFRVLGAQTIEPFKNSGNEARVRAMLSDIYFEVTRRRRNWVAYPEYREYRHYPVREAATETLQKWGCSYDSNAGIGPHVMYLTPPWREGLAWVGGVGAVLAVNWGRRGGSAGRRLIVGGSVAIAVAAATFAWRSQGMSDSFGWADGRWSYEVTSARGAFWFVRVEDGADRRVVRWWGEVLKNGEGPWFERMVPLQPNAGHVTFYAGEGQLDAAGDTLAAFQVTRTLIWVVIAPLCLPLLVLVMMSAGLIVRRMQWRRGGRCGVCGYNLRGSKARCSECGTVGIAAVSRVAQTR